MVNRYVHYICKQLVNLTSGKTFNGQWHGYELVGTLLLSGDGVFYFNQARGSIIVPDEFRGDQNIPMEWINNKGVKYAIDYQPYDFNDIWCKGHAMYSKELWHLVYQDIRDFQLKITLGEFKPSGKWYY